jgi:hypothetical protein
MVAKRSLEHKFVADACDDGRHPGCSTTRTSARTSTVAHYHAQPSRTGLFAKWDIILTLVHIGLTVPREKLHALLKHPAREIGTPPLQCNVVGSWSQIIFIAVHTACRRAIMIGTPAQPWVSFKEDLKGWASTAPLIASFTMPTMLLTDIEPMECLNICFSSMYEDFRASQLHWIGKAAANHLCCTAYRHCLS